MKEKIGAVILARGRGTRMNSDVPKQYMKAAGYPILYYSIKAFEQCDAVDEIVIVSGADDIEYCRTEIVEKYGFKKVKAIAAGGRERYHSVYHGLCALEQAAYGLIHDGARPMVSEPVILRNIEAVQKYKACVTAVLSKDTVKISRPDGTVSNTPDRSSVWIVQTPQTFGFELIKNAYEALLKEEANYTVTDDAMVVETFTKQPVYLVEGDYRNIKVTTPEDMSIIQHFVGDGANCNNI